MKDIIPPPTHKPKKPRVRPDVFGDEFGRCLISSIAGYELMDNGQINVYLKSGETSTFDFEVSYLANKAFAKLDSFFKTSLPTARACDVCSNKDRIDDDDSIGRTFCDFCFSHKEHFKAPGEAKDE